MRALFIVVAAFSAALQTIACGGGPSTLSPNPITPTPSASLTGTWSGTASDSSGTMMGVGLTTPMMNGTTWRITQNGSTFSGSMQFSGHGGASMMVSGTVTAGTGTFAMTMPAGSMMTMMNGSCSAVATGTFDLYDATTQMHGTYAGSNTCGGPFDHGQISMTRR